MTLQVGSVAAILVAASLVVGRAVALFCGRGAGAAPAIGFALLIIVADAALRLPGRAVTAAVACTGLVLAAGAVLILRHRAPRWERSPSPSRIERLAVPLAGLFATAGAAIPFLANGRVGLLGVSLDNDTATHLVWAEGLRSPAVANRYGLTGGYPLGPHSLADALAAATGARLDLVFSGLELATIVLLALVAAHALKGVRWWARAIAAALVAHVYLIAAYYAEGSFKEPMFALLLVAFVLHLEELRRRWGQTVRERAIALLPAAVLVAASLYVYSYTALAWIVITLVVWLAGEVVGSLLGWRQAGARPPWRGRDRPSMTAAAPVLIAVVVAIVLVVPTAGRVLSFAGSLGASPAASGQIAATDLGNLAHSLSPYEALGIWQRSDFRFAPADGFHAGELAALALAVLCFGVVRAFARRELLMPAALAACALVYWRASHGQSPYVTAKALVIASPIVALLGLRGLLLPARVSAPRWARPTRAVAAVVFIVFAGLSSLAVLRDEPVWPAAPTDELLTLARAVRGTDVLFLGNSDYSPWLFNQSNMSALAGTTNSLGRAAPRPSKPFLYGEGIDFDNVDPSTINRFAYVVTTTTPYASQPPAGYVLDRRLRLYELWRRVGFVRPRATLDPPGAPGSLLDCRRSPAARDLVRHRGEAAIMPVPVTRSLSAVAPGQSDRFVLPLARGDWELSLQYMSAMEVELSAEGRSWRMPAYLDRPGPLFPVGAVRSDGRPVVVTVRVMQPSPLTGQDLAAQLEALVATRLPDTRTMVPLRRACGRYVDWFTTSG